MQMRNYNSQNNENFRDYNRQQNPAASGSQGIEAEHRSKTIQVRDEPPTPVMPFTGFGKAYVPDQKMWEIYTANWGFVRGTIFPELDLPYAPKSVTPIRSQGHGHTEHKFKLLKALSVMDFMLMDLNLYLNSNPWDQEALAIHSRAANDAAELRNAYEKSFGPLRSCSTAADQSEGWQWINDPWPWEVEANFEI